MGGVILIPYDDEVGFAIGRLVPIFHRAMSDALGSQASTWVCVKKRSSAHSTPLDVSQGAVVAHDVYGGDSRSIRSFTDFLELNGIRIVMGLDVTPNAPWLPSARATGVSTIVSYWGAPMSSRNSGLKLLAKRLEVRCFHRSRPDLFIFESEAMRDLAVFGRGIPADRTTVIPTGVDTNVFRPIPGADFRVYERLGIPFGRKIIVFMGHLHERKGAQVLMNAANDLFCTFGRRDFHVLFLGGDEEEASSLDGFEGVALDHGFMTFAGYREDVPELLTGCYVGCIPSSGWDSFPMSSLEMQACGLPVVVSDLQGVPETIDPGITGLVVRAGDSRALAQTLSRVLDDEGGRRIMAARAKNRIQELLTKEHQVKNLSGILGELMQNQGH